MFKKIFYIISLLLGIAVVLKVSKPNREYKDDLELFVPIEIKPVPKPIKRKNLKSLNSRQLDILKLLEKRKILLPSDIYTLHPQVSTRTLRRDMTSLVNLNLVQQEGSTKDTKYILIG